MPTPFTLAGPAGRQLAASTVVYGPDVAPESELRLLGALDGRRILELGCGAGANTVALAGAGARVIALDESAEQVELARQACDAHGVRAELRDGPLAELAFVRADSVDACVSVAALAGVADIDRVFRQVHRVLRPEAPLVISLPHPALSMVAPDDDLRIRRSYWDPAPLHDEPAPLHDEPAPLHEDPAPLHEDPAPERQRRHHRTTAELFTGLQRANFRVDTVLEPEPTPGAPHSPFWDERFRWVPPVLIVRARKQGI